MQAQLIGLQTLVNLKTEELIELEKMDSSFCGSITKIEKIYKKLGEIRGLEEAIDLLKKMEVEYNV
ncbi:hypothetical protein FP76_gp090 [Bacillus phage Evoli]|uniref:Uncharacterized protein n=1 Tax=Bacillus phage Evoli TaxID=1486658 RepID=A0A024B047_9CAUD|nr:hypothetical protein FP76_gp090 [Bacillus phage Evoli]AHZ10004.1 hypothetical protein [Bacillus phage Evoli]